MGNQILCCKRKWSKLDESDEKVWLDDYDISSHHHCNTTTTCYPITSPDGFRHHYGQLNLVESSPETRWLTRRAKITTQHISEREPEDFDTDPSINACRSAIFTANANISNSVSSTKSSRAFGTNGYGSKIHRRWSSCSTVYIGSGCLFNPDKDTTMRSVAVAIKLLLNYQKKHPAVEHIHSDCGIQKPTLGIHLSETEKIYKDLYFQFDERKYSIKCTSLAITSGVVDGANAEVDHIYEFIKLLFRSTLFGPECAVVALILLERLVTSAEVDIFSWSWRRQVLACVLLASKVLDDQAVWNMDYCNILHGTSVDDLNALERHLLALLQFNIDVPLPVYARYFFDLLALADTSSVPGGLGTRRKLTPELAHQLQLIPAHAHGSPHVSTSGTARCHSGVDQTVHGVFDLPCTPKQLLRRSSLPTLHLSTEQSVLGKECPSVVNLPGKGQHPSDVPIPGPVSTMTAYPERESGFIYCEASLQSRVQQDTDGVAQPFKSNNQCSTSTMPDDADDTLVSYDPLIVDDETALINSCVNSTPVYELACADSKYRSSILYPKSLNPHYTFYQRYYKSGSALAHRWHSTGSEASRIREPAPVTTSRTTEVTSPMNQVIRAVMGNGRTVTYSLLRDAGLF